MSIPSFFIFFHYVHFHFYSFCIFKIRNCRKRTSSCYWNAHTRQQKKQRKREREMRELLMLHIFVFSLISKHTKHHWVVFESDLRFKHRRQKERKGKKKLKIYFFLRQCEKRRGNREKRVCIVDWRGGGTMKLIIKGYKARGWSWDDLCKHNDFDDSIWCVLLVLFGCVVDWKWRHSWNNFFWILYVSNNLNFLEKLWKEPHTNLKPPQTSKSSTSKLNDHHKTSQPKY